MHQFVSETAKYGDLTRGPRVIDDHVKETMRTILGEIRSGQFAREWVDENAAGLPRYRELMQRDLEHPIERVGKSLARSHELAPPLRGGLKRHLAHATGLVMKGADVLLGALRDKGVDTIFGYPGGAIMPVYDALLGSGIRHVLVRHEQAAAFAADGYARVSGRPGVCIATSGPGATNLITGIANAYLDSVPMIAITGQVATPLMGTDAFQEVDIFGMTLPVVKHSYIARHVDGSSAHRGRSLADRDERPSRTGAHRPAEEHRRGRDARCKAWSHLTCRCCDRST